MSDVLEESQALSQEQPQLQAALDINGNKVQNETIKKKGSRRKRPRVTSSPKRRWSAKKKASRKSTQAVHSLSASPYKYTDKIQASKKEIYAVKFSRFLDRDILAVACEKRVDVFECLADTPFKLLKSFKDDNDYFYALAWSYSPDDQSPILAAGGELGVIRILNATHGVEMGFFQHTGIINDLKFHTVNPSILASASDDRSIRLWNISSSVCVSIFSGTHHSNQVLSIDFSEDGKHLISSGMDRMLLIWGIDEDDVMKSMDYNKNKQQPFSTKRIYKPEFSTDDVNTNYIDSVVWHAQNIFISRSADGDIVQWQAGETNQLDMKSNYVDHWRFLREPDQSSVFFIRMDLDPKKRFLACGTNESSINVWDFKDGSQFQFKGFGNAGIVRMVSFSNDSEIMCACTGSGHLVRFDKKQQKVKQEVEDEDEDEDRSVDL